MIEIRRRGGRVIAFRHMPHTKRLEEGGGMHRFRDALARVLAERVEFPKGALVTVVDAKITRDTRHAKGVISVLPVTMENSALDALQEYRHDILDGLAEQLRLRRIPEIHWDFDRAEDHVSRIDEEIRALRTKGEL